MLVLEIAQFGSGLATNTWAQFGKVFGTSTGTNVVTPATPQMANIIHAMLLSYTCMEAYNLQAASAGGSPQDKVSIQNQTLSSPSKTVIYNFELNINISNSVCGSFAFKYPSAPDSSTSAGNAVTDAQVAGYNGAKGLVDTLAKTIAQATTTPGATAQQVTPSSFDTQMQAIVKAYITPLDQGLSTAQSKLNNGFSQELQTETATKGWIAAPLYFNVIAKMNGNLMDAANNLPIATAPSVFNIQACNLGPGQPGPSASSRGIIAAMCAEEQIYGNYSPSTLYKSTTGEYQAVAGNAIGTGSSFLDIIGKIFTISSPSQFISISSTNPIASIISIGDLLYSLGISALAAVFALSAAAGISDTFWAKIFSAGISTAIGSTIRGTLSGPIGSILTVIDGIVLTAGITLAFLLPLMPFFKFLGGVITWLLEVFEAVIGAPVWALAHLRPDGEGLSGPAATQGYGILFAIFLRPIGMVLALVAAYLLFIVAATAINELYDAAVNGANGVNSSTIGYNPLTVIIYSVIFAAFVYSLMNTCLKTLDFIPDNMTRWIGMNSAHPQQDDHHGLARAAAFGGAAAVSKMGGSAVQGMNQLRQLKQQKDLQDQQGQIAAHEGAVDHIRHGGNAESAVSSLGHMGVTPDIANRAQSQVDAERNGNQIPSDSGAKQISQRKDGTDGDGPGGGNNPSDTKGDAALSALGGLQAGVADAKKTADEAKSAVDSLMGQNIGSAGKGKDST